MYLLYYLSWSSSRPLLPYSTFLSVSLVYSRCVNPFVARVYELKEKDQIGNLVCQRKSFEFSVLSHYTGFRPTPNLTKDHVDYLSHSVSVCHKLFTENNYCCIDIH